MARGRVAHSALVSGPLDVPALIAAVSDPRAGGLGLFVGKVRDIDGGRAVSALSYEAHPGAAALLAEVVARFATPDVVAVAAVHRLGDLQIGDIAVAVAVSAEHRAEALTTCHALIDAVKSEVPIWKRQIFADGSHEWVGAG